MPGKMRWMRTWNRWVASLVTCATWPWTWATRSTPRTARSTGSWRRYAHMTRYRFHSFSAFSSNAPGSRNRQVELFCLFSDLAPCKYNSIGPVWTKEKLGKPGLYTTPAQVQKAQPSLVFYRLQGILHGYSNIHLHPPVFWFGLTTTVRTSNWPRCEDVRERCKHARANKFTFTNVEMLVIS